MRFNYFDSDIFHAYFDELPSALKKKKKQTKVMSNSVILSAMTMIAITGITLTSLKYRNDNEHSDVSFDIDTDNDNETMETNRVNPKFHFYDTLDSNHSSIAKRSANEDQYSIEDRNVSMIDEEKRQKVKQVQQAP